MLRLVPFQFSASLALVFLAFLVPGCVSDPPAVEDEQQDLRYWLENMVWHHHYSAEEVAQVTGRSRDEAEQILEESRISWEDRPHATRALKPDGKIKVLPYPGGRHPRIGFLDGAIDPHRDTKASIFLPWEDAGYVVVDLPEALWSNLGLTYLAHTHIPTIWDKEAVKLERIDWKRRADGELRSHRRLPNGIEFAARIIPKRETVDMELRLKNGTGAKLEGLRTQICVLLKGAPDFNAQTVENKTIHGPVIAVRSAPARDGVEERKTRWVATVWERVRRCWRNARCPCMHSDPVFPDLASGDEAVVRGRVFFYEGDDIRDGIGAIATDTVFPPMPK